MKNYELEKLKNVKTTSSSLVFSNYQNATTKNGMNNF